VMVMWIVKHLPSGWFHGCRWMNIRFHLLYFFKGKFSGLKSADCTTIRMKIERRPSVGGTLIKLGIRTESVTSLHFAIYRWASWGLLKAGSLKPDAKRIERWLWHQHWSEGLWCQMEWWKDSLVVIHMNGQLFEFGFLGLLNLCFPHVVEK
jgi:hypothetical protein